MQSATEAVDLAIDLSATLTAKQLEVLDMTTRGLTQCEQAELLGISHQAVSCRWAAAKRKIAEYFSGRLAK